MPRNKHPQDRATTRDLWIAFFIAAAFIGIAVWYAATHLNGALDCARERRGGAVTLIPARARGRGPHRTRKTRPRSAGSGSTA